MSQAERIGLFGGSFDPPHRGHLEPVRAARAVLGLERVLYLPTAQPPHKAGPRQAPPWARYAMVELSLLHEEGLYASPYELTPGTPAYTIDTLTHFRRQHPQAQLYYFLGGDSFAQLASWRRWRELAELATLVVLARPGWHPNEVVPSIPAEVLALLTTGAALQVAAPEVAVSSTSLRAVLARGADPAPGDLAPLVLDYVKKYDLYR